MKTGYLSLTHRNGAFAALGGAMRQAAAGSAEGFAGSFARLIDSVHLSNPWFTPDNVRLALSSLGNALMPEKLDRWLSAYPELDEEREPVTVGVVMAGNIPMTGFHDLLCVLITGNRLQARLSSKDDLLIRAVAQTLTDIEPAFKPFIELTSERLKEFDLVIATGSNNTSRYFEYYFRKTPSIIRRNRNSMAIIDGTETDAELEKLGDDIFSYFGLGCRNVSKLFLPQGYDPASLTGHWGRYASLLSHYKYAVNLDHNRAVMTVNRETFTDGGFILLRESASLTPPLGVLHCEYYDVPERPLRETESHRDALQCVAGHGHIPFGTTQQPELWDYADNIDTVRFVLKKDGIL